MEIVENIIEPENTKTYWDLFKERSKDNKNWKDEYGQLKKIHSLVSNGKIDYEPMDYLYIGIVKHSIENYFKENNICPSVQYNYVNTLCKYIDLVGQLPDEVYAQYIKYKQEKLDNRKEYYKNKEPEQIIVDYEIKQLIINNMNKTNNISMKIMGKYLISAIETKDINMLKVTLTDFVETIISTNEIYNGCTKVINLFKNEWYINGKIIKLPETFICFIKQILENENPSINNLIFSKTKKYTKLTDDISKDNIYEYNVYAINSFATQFKRIYEISWSEIIKKISIILN